MVDKSESSLETEADDLSSPSLLREYTLFLRQNKMWWLIPMLVAVSFVVLLIILGTTAAAPFLYDLF